jgi:hypothetical protein
MAFLPVVSAPLLLLFGEMTTVAAGAAPDLLLTTIVAPVGPADELAELLGRFALGSNSAAARLH